MVIDFFNTKNDYLSMTLNIGPYTPLRTLKRSCWYLSGPEVALWLQYM